MARKPRKFQVISRENASISSWVNTLALPPSPTSFSSYPNTHTHSLPPREYLCCITIFLPGAPWLWRYAFPQHITTDSSPSRTRPMRFGTRITTQPNDAYRLSWSPDVPSHPPSSEMLSSPVSTGSAHTTFTNANPTHAGAAMAPYRCVSAGVTSKSTNQRVPRPGTLSLWALCLFIHLQCPAGSQL
jgi:hypothetical protein